VSDTTDNNEEENFVELTRDFVREKIRHVLLIYPKLSMSMLQVGIGTGVPPRFWHPVLEDMKKEGLITVETRSLSAPNGRDQIYKIVQLSQT